MATPILEDLSLQLSRKIHDPVLTGLDKGLIFTAQQRLDYINNGFSAMIKALEAVHKDMTFVLPDYMDVTEIVVVASGGAEKITAEQLKVGTYYEICDLYYQAQGSTLKRADKISPRDYYSVTLSYNEFFPKPIQTAGQEDDPLHYYNKAYWTMLNGYIQLVPSATEADYVRLMIIHKRDFVTYTYGSDTDIFMAKDYYDLLLLYAARIAFVDSGGINKFQTTSAFIAEQLKVIGMVKAEYIRTDKNKGPN